MPGTRAEAETWALDWIDAWNRRDLDAVLGQFDDNVVFSSPRVREVTGSSAVQGKDALRGYWEPPIIAAHSLRFELERIVWDAVTRELGIVHNAEIDGKHALFVDLLTFAEDGRIVRGEGLYGVPPEG